MCVRACVRVCVNYIAPYQMFRYAISNFFAYCFAYRIARIRFDFTLGAFYQKSIIESNNAVDAEFFLEVLYNNELHSGHIHVEVQLNIRLTRFCNDELRSTTVLDIIVLIFLMLSSATYVISIYRSTKLAGVCKLYVYTVL